MLANRESVVGADLPDNLAGLLVNNINNFRIALAHQDVSVPESLIGGSACRELLWNLSPGAYDHAKVLWGIAQLLYLLPAYFGPTVRANGAG